MTDFILTVLAVLTANYIHAFIYSSVRADKYEDVLAEKVAKRVKEEMKNDRP